MGTEEGERMIYKVAKQRGRPRRDTGEVNVIKDQIGEMLTDEVKKSKRGGESISTTHKLWKTPGNSLEKYQQ